MKILAVDTTGEALSLAVTDGAKTWTIKKIFGKPHDETLLPQVDRLLAKAKIELKELDAIAAASGPGRFTGIRIGMAYAAVAARCLGIPALAVSRLEALAFGRPEKKLCAVVPAFRGEVYYQLFPKGEPVWAKELPKVDVPLAQGDPDAAALLGPAAAKLKRPGKFEPLYLKPAGYERTAR